MNGKLLATLLTGAIAAGALGLAACQPAENGGRLTEDGWRTAKP